MRRREIAEKSAYEQAIQNTKSLWAEYQRLMDQEQEIRIARQQAFFAYDNAVNKERQAYQEYVSRAFKTRSMT